MNSSSTKNPPYLMVDGAATKCRNMTVMLKNCNIYYKLKCPADFLMKKKTTN